MQRRDKLLLGISLAAVAGGVALFAATAWFIWNESVVAEEEHVGELAETLGKRTEALIVGARDMLAALNRLDAPRCSQAHLQAMQEAAIAQPQIRAIGYWRAAERLCGAGYIQGVDLKPPRADRIYDSGVIAWWPGPWTEVGGTPLFLMRYGEHDVAIDPRMLLAADPIQDRQAGLWVEHLRMSAVPWDAELPSPESLPPGLSVEREKGRVVSRFSLGTVFPIDIVAVEPLGRFWDRYFPTLAITGGFGLLLAGAWIFGVSRFLRHRLSLPTELRIALARGNIQVHYQPVIELATGRCIGAEALARWPRDNGELIGPDVFIPIAEEIGLVPRITLAVLARVAQDLGSLLRLEPELSINVNLSPEDLKSEHFDLALARTIDKAGLSPRTVKLEITERALVNSDLARALIGKLRMRGHRIAIDDFGTGYSSLSYLQSFELDALKIDKSFVDAIGKEAVTSHVVGHVIEMGKSLGLELVAEGVETTPQVQWLLGHGVELGQGFLFSPALTVGDFCEYLRVYGSSVRSDRVASGSRIGG